MTAATLKRWAWVHKWASLVCTVFMLLLCLTGLPLIFHHEIGHWLGTEVEAPDMPPDTPRASLDRVVEAARTRQPDKLPQFLSREPDDNRFWYVTFGDTLTSNENTRTVAVDARTAEVLAEPRFDEGFMSVMYRLHVDLFADLPGKLFLGLMGLLLVIAIVSGAVLYGPFARKQPFATVRRHRSRRMQWLDMHNVLGIVTLTWALVVGTTGMINTWADLVLKLWQVDQLSEMTAPYKGLPVPSRLASLQASAQQATAREPDMRIGFVAWPGTLFSSPHHYAVFMRGKDPLTARLLKPVLVDATTAQVTDSRVLPWYVTTLLVSQPLHFGDYGGMPMKVIWAVLDLVTIAVLVTGLYLWWVRRRVPFEAHLLDAMPAAAPRGQAS